MDNAKSQTALKADQIFSVFTPAFLDEAFCRKWIIDRLHPEGLVCPRCRKPLRKQRQEIVLSGGKTACFECGKQFGALTGTVFSGFRSDYRTIVFVLFLIGAGYSTNDIMVKTGLSRTSICRYRRMFG